MVTSSRKTTKSSPSSRKKSAARKGAGAKKAQAPAAKRAGSAKKASAKATTSASRRSTSSAPPSTTKKPAKPRTARRQQEKPRGAKGIAAKKVQAPAAKRAGSAKKASAKATTSASRRSTSSTPPSTTKKPAKPKTARRQQEKPKGANGAAKAHTSTTRSRTASAAATTNAAAPKTPASSTLLLSRVRSITESIAGMRDEMQALSKAVASGKDSMPAISGMSESLAAVLVQIQKQSRQIASLKKETQGLFEGLEEISDRSESKRGSLESSLHDVQQKIEKIAEVQGQADSEAVAEKINDSVRSIIEDSESIAGLSRALDATRNEIRVVGARAASATGTGIEIDALRTEISGIADAVNAGSASGTHLKQELDRLADRVETVAKSSSGVQEGIRETLGQVAAETAKIKDVDAVLDGFKSQLDAITSKTESAARIEIPESVTDRLESIGSEIAILAKSADEVALTKDSLDRVREEIISVKSDIAGIIGIMDQKMSSASGILQRQQENAADLHGKIDEMYSRIQEIKGSSDESAREASKETARLLRLSEYQSAMRMSSESKYGDLDTIREMSAKTADINGVFGGGGDDDNGSPGGLPPNVRRWAAGKILDCADRWEIRFADVYSIMNEMMGADMTRESINMSQVRDIYGIRAVNEINEGSGSA